MSIALAGTLCNPLDKLGEARERGRTLDQEWEEVEVGVPGSGEAGRGKIRPRTLVIRGKYLKSIDFLGLSKIPIPMT